MSDERRPAPACVFLAADASFPAGSPVEATTGLKETDH